MKKELNKTNKTKTSTRQKPFSGSGRAAGKGQAGKGKGPKVIAMFRYRQRFELRDNDRHCRAGGQIFTKDYTGCGGGDDAIDYLQQFALMGITDGAEYCLYYGVYRQLINLTARQSRAYRGYLLDANKQPLSDSQIAKLLRFESKKMAKILKRFEAVQLIEKVDLPKFDLSVNEQPTDTPTDSNTESSDTGKRAERGQVAGKVRTSAGSVRVKSAQVRDCFKKENDNVNGNENLNKKNKSNRQRELLQTSRLVEGQGQQQTTQSPPTTQPIEPTISDPGESKVISYPKAPPESLRHNEPQAIGNILAGIQHRYSADAKQFGADIFQALGLTCQPTSEQGKRELGSFASLWMDAQGSGISTPALDELRLRAVREAVRIRKHWKNRSGNISAVFCSVFKKMFAKASPARASPVDVK